MSFPLSIVSRYMYIIKQWAHGFKQLICFSEPLSPTVCLMYVSIHNVTGRSELQSPTENRKKLKQLHILLLVTFNQFKQFFGNI